MWQNILVNIIFLWCKPAAVCSCKRGKWVSQHFPMAERWGVTRSLFANIHSTGVCNQFDLLCPNLCARTQAGRAAREQRGQEHVSGEISINFQSGHLKFNALQNHYAVVENSSHCKVLIQQITCETSACVLHKTHPSLHWSYRVWNVYLCWSLFKVYCYW